MVLLRLGESGMEVLLLQRSPRSGFIPGAWVFPGGRLDPEDADPSVLSGVESSAAWETQDPGVPYEPESTSPAFWVAAVRETFEETGILVAPGSNTVPRGDLARARGRLLRREARFPELLKELGLGVDVRRQAYIGHWLTPECEPRRYETRFFAAAVGAREEVSTHQAEMVGHRWLTPDEALRRNRRGSFPMVLPTFFTLEELQSFETPARALDALQSRPIMPRLPRPERTQEGIRFRFPE
jgi:8-oxo-dGTP pyrophosphatase MutT (NUDIX family)